MSNPFMNNNIFPNLQSKPDLLLGNKSQTNPLSNNLNNGLKNETNNPIFNQNNNPNPFKINFEPNSNNLNNQNDNNKNMTNLFPPLKTQQNNIQNSSTNNNINQNNIIKNSNPIINNNNTNTNTSNIFNTAQFTNKPPDSNNNNSKQNILNIIPKINPLEIKKEEKKEEPNIFISQSNNILNKSNDVPEKSQINNQLKISDLPSFNPLQEKKQKSKVSEFINNLLSEDKIIFSEKEKEEYEKNQLSFKKNEEILDEFKNMLDNHKEKYTKSVSNMRLFDKKLMEKIKITETKFTNLKINMTNKDKTITDALDYLKKKMNNYNNLTTIKTQNFEENNKFYKDLNETSEKIKKIDNNINIIWNSLNRKEENKNELFDISDEKQRENYINNINNIDNYKLHRINNNIILNNKMDGIILERNELDKIKKIYVEQKDLNNIFTECYDGLYGLKSIQDEFDIKYERLKNSLIKKIDERNVNFSKRSNDTKEEDLDIYYNN